MSTFNMHRALMLMQHHPEGTADWYDPGETALGDVRVRPDAHRINVGYHTGRAAGYPATRVIDGTQFVRSTWRCGHGRQDQALYPEGLYGTITDG